MSGAPLVFDRPLARHRLRRALRSGFVDVLAARAAEELADRLAAVTRRFEVGLDLGSPDGAAAAALAASGRVGRTFRLAPVPPDGPPAVPTAVADEEALPIGPESVDLAVSLLALQGTNDLPGALLQIRRALRPDGLLLAAFLGGDTLAELREAFAAAESAREGGASPRVAPFADVRSAGGLLQRAGFALPVVDLDRVTLRYGTPFGLLADLRAMGLTNVLRERSRRPLRRGTLLRAVEIYRERFADPDGRVRATFDTVWLSGWAPHASQQQPLKPGSARTRLADALGVPERNLDPQTGRMS